MNNLYQHTEQFIMTRAEFRTMQLYQHRGKGSRLYMVIGKCKRWKMPTTILYCINNQKILYCRDHMLGYYYELLL
jgi:hypothetical protein